MICNPTGKRIVNVHQVFETNPFDQDLELSQSYLTLDDDSVISLPLSIEPLVQLSAIPKSASRVDSDFLSKIQGAVIVRVLDMLYDDGDLSDECVMLEMDNGRYITEVNSGVKGTAEANLWIFTKDDFERLFEARSNPRRFA